MDAIIILFRLGAHGRRQLASSLVGSERELEVEYVAEEQANHSCRKVHSVPGPD